MTLRTLRAEAIGATLFAPRSLDAAIARLGFVQADPIRAPARAQDLILRQRVKNYRVDDLDRNYARLEVEEDYLYAYGFLARDYRPLLHPRAVSALTNVDRTVLEAVAGAGVVHPRELEARLQGGRTVNGWGGYSNATTHALDRLHHRGFLRVAGRASGIRLYEATPAAQSALGTTARLERIAMLIARIFTPSPLPVLRHTIAVALHQVSKAHTGKSALDALFASGELERFESDGVTYARPAERDAVAAVPAKVRFLAPFDPLVWDRKRFELLWGWPYRFEAYVPAPKRTLGYYALPLLWRDDVPGWVNVTASKDGAFDIRDGYVRARPKGAAFRDAFDAEAERLRAFLSPRRGAR